MTCIILAAGYGTRLYPLTKNFPKPLLKINNKPIIEWILDDLNENCDIAETIIISNHKYFSKFEDWSRNSTKQYSFRLKIIDDGTKSNENRLGAVRDIALTIENQKIQDDILVVAGDNILDFSLKEFIDYFNKKNSTCVMRYKFILDNTKKCQYGVCKINSEELITNMEEKPNMPKSNWAIPPFYIYKKNDLKMIQQGIDQGCGIDAPGEFIEWLYLKIKIYAMEMPGKRFDIGDLNSYKKITELLK